MSWKYTGKGEFVGGVPARDLTDDEMSDAVALLKPLGEDPRKCGLYTRVDDKRPAPDAAPATAREG